MLRGNLPSREVEPFEVFHQRVQLGPGSIGAQRAAVKRAYGLLKVLRLRLRLELLRLLLRLLLWLRLRLRLLLLLELLLELRLRLRLHFGKRRLRQLRLLVLLPELWGRSRGLYTGGELPTDTAGCCKAVEAVAALPPPVLRKELGWNERRRLRQVLFDVAHCILK